MHLLVYKELRLILLSPYVVFAKIFWKVMVVTESTLKSTLHSPGLSTEYSLNTLKRAKIGDMMKQRGDR